VITVARTTAAMCSDDVTLLHTFESSEVQI
jgi:hypothetical protein